MFVFIIILGINETYSQGINKREGTYGSLDFNVLII